MVMLSKILAKPAVDQKSLESFSPALAREREMVYVYEVNPLLGRGICWRAVLPLADLMNHLPDTCRYSPNIRALRYWGALAGLLLGVAAVSGAFYPLFSYYSPILGFLFGAGPGMVAGWALMPSLPSIWFFDAPRPFWVVGRVWLKDSESSNTEDPEFFTAFNDGWRRYVMPIEFSFLSDGAYISSDGIDISQSHDLVGPQTAVNGRQSKEPRFLPVVNRATSLYENLQMRVYKAMHKRNLTGWQKIQITSIAVLAGVALAALIFVVVVTSDEKTVVVTEKASAAYISHQGVGSFDVHT